MEFSNNSEPLPSPKSGKFLLGKYELGHLLGRGTFAKVYKARSISDGTAVAVKIIDKSKITGTTMSTMITQEVSIMRRLIHPNIIKLHEVMATKSKIFLVMEYAKGGDILSKICQHGRLTEPEARIYFQQLLSALQFCHSKGITHRDIKPENLLLDQNGNLKVSDFGLSALPEQLKGGGLLQTVCGTPAYTAPEVLRRRGYNGAKADAWSCGVILYVFLAGCLPFEDTNLAIMYRKIQKREFDFPPWLSQPVQRVISRLLDPNPDTRIAIEDLMELPWFKSSPQRKGGEICESSLALSSSNIKNSYSYLFSGAYHQKDGKQDPALNAFDIISLSSGLDLSGIFEEGKRSQKRFTSNSSIDMITGRIDEIGAKLGYMAERIKGELVIGLWKGGLVLSVEILQLNSSLVLVDLKVLSDQGREFEEICWGDLKAGLEDIVLAWHQNGA